MGQYLGRHTGQPSERHPWKRDYDVRRARVQGTWYDVPRRRTKAHEYATIIYSEKKKQRFTIAHNSATFSVNRIRCISTVFYSCSLRIVRGLVTCMLVRNLKYAMFLVCCRCCFDHAVRWNLANSPERAHFRRSPVSMDASYSCTPLNLRTTSSRVRRCGTDFNGSIRPLQSQCI